MRDRVRGLVRESKSKDEVGKTLTAEFGWAAGALGARSIEPMMAELR
jgi:hypothetical protein